MKRNSIASLVSPALLSLGLAAAPALADNHAAAPDEAMAAQRAGLAQNTQGKGFGPQSPRDIDAVAGSNSMRSGTAPHYSKMNLCNIHFHENAEHKGGEFTRFAGNGNGQGKGTGFQYAGDLTAAEMTPVSGPICSGKYGDLQSGDTIELHYVHSTARVQPGPTLGSCLSDSMQNPDLRVEAQVMVLVNDSEAGDFVELTKLGERDGFQQALNIPNDTGTPVQYEGSTTGPGYNEIGSPLDVSWSVRPKVLKVDINTVGRWCEGNVFDEDHAHGVRNLVVNPDLLSEISS